MYEMPQNVTDLLKWLEWDIMDNCVEYNREYGK